MIEYKHNVRLIWRNNPDAFILANKDIYGNNYLRLGSGHKSVERMAIHYSEEMKLIMPPILRTHPSDVTWYDKINNYWHSVSYMIPASGLDLEVGLKYDLNNSVRKEFISALMADKGLKTEKDLAEFCEKNVPLEERYKYAEPINIENYLTWRFALISAKVANSTADINNSTNIDFVLIDAYEVERNRKKSYEISKEADKLFFELVNTEKSKDKLKSILYVYEVDATSLKDDIDIEIKLKELSSADPEKFVKICNDPNLLTRSRVERYIIRGVLKRADNGIITDANDISLVIGNSTDEAVSYFSSEDPIKLGNVSRFKNAYENLTKTK